MLKLLKIFSIILTIVILSSCLSGCGILYRRHSLTLKRSDFTPVIKELISANPHSFDKPFTVITMLDSSPCGARLSESVYWSDWQQHITNAGNGFVFATSSADSAGLVYAALLDSVNAQVLVIPSYEKSLPRLSDWEGAAPFHLLVDSTGALLGIWVAVFDPGESTLMLDSIDSLIAVHNNSVSSE